VMSRLKSERWSKNAMLNVTVQSGTVKLWGIVDSEMEKQAARVAVESVEGVKVVENYVVTVNESG
jgi:osmotically-inducible protein OsmY